MEEYVNKKPNDDNGNKTDAIRDTMKKLELTFPYITS